jgi:3-phenylpropionate/cinnamic acid dioxygenase small subunit
MVLKPAEANEKLEVILEQASLSIQYNIDEWLVAMGMAQGYEQGIMYPMPERFSNTYRDCPRPESFTLSKDTKNKLADRLIVIYKAAGWNVEKKEETIQTDKGTDTKVYLHFKRG